MKRSQDKSLGARIKQYRASYVLMLPFTLIFITFVVLPVFISIGLGFTNYNILQPPSFVGLDNYVRLFFDDEIFLMSIQNKLIFAVITGPVSYLMCISRRMILNMLRIL